MANHVPILGHMIRSRLKQLRLEKQAREGREISHRMIEAETGIARTTINSLANNAFQGTRNDTLDTLCKYFGVSLGELLEYVPDSQQEVASK